MLKVSIIVPNYNHARFLHQRLDSIFVQTFQDIEVIILDDASTDDSREVIAEYSASSNVRCIFNDVNSGSPFAQWNRGVRETSGEYVWIAESDDYANPDLLAKLVDTLETMPAVGLAYCQSWIVDDVGRIEGLFSRYTDFLDKARWTRSYVNNGRDEIGRYLCHTCTIPNASAVVFRRTAYEAANGADETMYMAGDYHTWIKLLLRGDVAFVAEPLNYFRFHDRTVRSSIQDRRAKWEAYQVSKLMAIHSAAIEAESPGACDTIGDWLLRRWGAYALEAPTQDLPTIDADLQSALKHLECSPSRTVQGAVYGGLLFARHRAGDYATVRSALWKAVRADPRWLVNRGVLSIVAQAFLGLGRRRTAGK